MRIRIVLSIILLGVGLCLVPVMGRGEIVERKPISVSWYMDEYTEDPAKGLDLWREDCDLRLATYLDFCLLTATTRYIMTNPNTFQYVSIFYDRVGRYRSIYPAGVDTTGKISIEIRDTRSYFSGLSGLALMEAFGQQLEIVYSYISTWATDMNADIVAKFLSEGGVPLGYFYEGEFHLVER